MFLLLAIAAALAAAEPPAPAPDPIGEAPRGLAAAAICAGSCLAGGGALALAMTGAYPMVAVAPVLGLVVAGAGAALAESAVMPTAPPKAPAKARLWLPLWATGGFLVVGGVAAAGGYALGFTGSSDAQQAFGIVGALVAATVGGGIGAGVGTLVGTHVEPPDFSP